MLWHHLLENKKNPYVEWSEAKLTHNACLYLTIRMVCMLMSRVRLNILWMFQWKAIVTNTVSRKKNFTCIRTGGDKREGSL